MTEVVCGTLELHCRARRQVSGAQKAKYRFEELARMDSQSMRWLRRVASPAVSINRQLVDARFVRMQRLDPSLKSRILGPPMVIAGRIRRALRSAYDEEVLARYVSLHAIHYGPGGRGYAPLQELSSAEAEQKYTSLVSRVEYFVDTFPGLLDYQDGDSFVDLGCGMGQNIRMLSQRFPNSSITGIDISADAVELIRTAEQNPRVSTRVGDVLDLRVLDEVLASGPDHVIVSHVFALLFASTAEETRRLRSELIKQLAGACRKSVIILDQFGRRAQLEVSIEQLNRAVIRDDVLEYFASIPSMRAFLANSPRSQAIICQRLVPFDE